MDDPLSPAPQQGGHWTVGLAFEEERAEQVSASMFR
jgi:hypothetical protein